MTKWHAVEFEYVPSVGIHVCIVTSNLQFKGPPVGTSLAKISNEELKIDTEI
jgi:hypothetical protein